MDEYWSKLFKDKVLIVDKRQNDYPYGFISNDWKAVHGMYKTLHRFGIPTSNLKLLYDKT